MFERRIYARTFAQRHASGHDYSIEVDGQRFGAQLMDISRGGANLKLLEFPEANLTGKQGTVADDRFSHQYLKGLSYTVVWSQFNEMGIAFQEPLGEHTGALSYYSSHRS